jgi:hypothetical protein
VILVYLKCLVLTYQKLTDEVRGHEDLSQLVVVLVVDLPKGVLLEVGVLPEPGKGNGAGVLVGVLALPLVKDEGRAAKLLERVLGLRSGLGLLFLLLLLGLRGSLGLLLLGSGLLLGWHVLDGLLDELELVDDGSDDGLVANGLVPTSDVGVLCPPLLVEEELEATAEDAEGEDVSEGDALANEVGVDQEVLLEDADGLEGSLLGVLNVLLVVGVAALERTEPATKRGEDLLVGEGHPPQDGGVVLLGLAKEGGLLILRGDWNKSASGTAPMTRRVKWRQGELFSECEYKVSTWKK